MKILSYNINGIRSFNRTGKLAELFADFADYDMFCFQEVKMSDIVELRQILSDRKFIASISEKKGYAGVLTISKYPSTEHVISVNNSTEFTSGRIVMTDCNMFYIVNVYVPNSGNKTDIRKEWDRKFKSYIASLDKPVIICGDMNVCASELDYWGNYSKSIDSGPGLMQFEIDDFTALMHDCNLIDCYRYINNDIRKYSWFSTRNKNDLEKNQGWRLDYFLASKTLSEYIIDCDVKQGYQSPDHSPVTLEIKNAGKTHN